MATPNQNSRNTSDIDAQLTAGALANSDTQNAESHTAAAAAEAPTLQAVPTLTIDPFAGDNILTRSESITVQALSGTTTGVEAGKTVNIMLGDWVYAYATVQEDGRWKVDIENWQMSNLMQFNAGSEQPLSAAVINEAGEVAESTVQVAIEPDWPSLVLNALAGDNVISGPEGGVMQVVSGATHGVEAGQVVTITINGISYSAEVLADGTWRTEVPAADVAALPDGAQILATVSNAAGQQAGDSAVLIVDNTLPSLTFNTFVGDNVLSDAEALRTQTLTGITSGIEPGQTVTVKLNGYTYTSQIGEEGSFSVRVPPAELLKLSNGQVEITASATNQAGQVTNSSGHMTVAFTTERIIVNGVAGDNYINKEESGNGFNIIGSAPSLPANTPITITIGTKNFGTRVEADGSWRTMLDIDDIRSFPDGQYTMTFSAPGSASTSVDVGIYVQAWEKLHIDVEEPFGDGVLTAGEAEEGQVITGTTSGLNLQVRVYVDTSQFTTTSDSEGRWSITVPAEVLLGMMAIPDQTSGYIHAEVTDIAGNSQSNGRNFEIAAQDIGLTLNPVAEDNRINAVEAAAGIVISGSADTTAAGLTVTLKIGGLERTTTIQADGSWSVPLSTSELVSLPEGYVEVSVSVPGSTPISQSVEVAIQSNPIPTLATPFEDGTLSADESASDQTLSGTTGVSGEDQNVAVTFAGKEYLATVDNQGNWQVTLPAVDLQAVPAGAAALSIVATDDAGNSGVLNTTVQVEPPQGAITIDPVTGDNLVSYAEAVAGITLTGSTRGLAEGSTLTLSIADETYSVTTDAEGRWSLPLAEGQVIGVWNDPVVLLTVSAPEADGPAATQEIENYTNRRPEPTVEAPFGNSVLSVAEAATDQTLVGSIGLSGANQQVVITLGGSDYTGQVDEGGRWQVTLPAAALQALEEGTQALAITATNAAGESKTLSVNVEVALTPPTLTLEPVAGDDVITFAEAEAEEGILLTGHASVSQGSIALTLGDQSWITETDSQGNWSQLIPAHTFSYPEGAFPDGNYALVATLTDANGNSTTVSRPVSLQADAGTLPAISVTNGLDSVLNGAERQVAQAISGTTRHVEAGQAVTLSVNEQTYSAEVLADGSWSLIIPAADIAALPAGSNILQVAVADRAGNPAETELVRFAIEESLGGIALDTVAGDNRINAYEAGSDLLVQGVATNVAEGTAVTLALSGRSYQAEVQADGRWQATVPAADVQALGDGITTAQVTTTDQNGDPLADSLSLTLITHPATLATLDPPFGDGYLNIGEAATPQVLSGTTGNAGVGQSVSLSLAGHTLRGTVDEAGRWSVPVPVEILQQLPAEALLIAVEAMDAAGNVSSVLEYVTAVLTAPTVTINALTGDNLLDAAELGVPLAIAGTTRGVADGQVLTLTLGTLALTTEVTGGGLWQVIVPAEQLGQLANGSSTVTASVADVAGNEATASQIVTLNNTLDGIAFDLIAGDNRIDAQEAANGFNIGGLVSGVAPGTQVTLTLGDYSDLTYTNEDGSWGIWIPGNLIRTQGLLTATVETVDADGNPLSASVDLFSSANALPQVTINPLPYVNIEATQTGITLTGETHFSGAGQSLTLTLAGQDYSAQVENNGTWSVFLPPEALQTLTDGSVPFSVVVTDSGGNQSQASAALDVDVTAPQLTLEPVTGDNVLNQGELQQDLVLAGTSDEPYGWISASFNGHTYTGTSDENGFWSIVIPAASLNGLAPGTQILSVTLSDPFGNPTTLQQEVEIASNDLPLLTILPFTGDNQLLGAERSVAQMLTGTTTHVEAGQIVTVTLNGETYSATVQSDGQWSLIVPQEDLAELVNLASGQADLVASVSNQAGDAVTDLVSLTIVTNRPSLAFDIIAGDNRLNASEAGGDLVVVGKVFGVPAENPITVTLNGQTYIATVEGSDWSITLPAADLAALPDGAIVITAEAEDTFFNLISSALTLTVAIHDLPEVGYDTPFGDGVLSAAEAAADQLLTGQTGQTGIAQTVTVTLGGETFTGEVDAAGLWRVTLPTEALQALPAGPASYTVTVTDVAGNSDSQEVAFTAAASAPLLQIDPLTGDNLIDQTEALGEIVVTGSVTDLNALPGATLNITLAGVTYPATLDESGAWSATLPFGALLDFQDGDYTLSATLVDGAGNVSEASQTFTLDLYTQPYLGINAFAGDNVLNGAEQQIDQLVDGTAYGVEAGQIVTLTLNGQSYSATVGQGGSWSTTIPAADLAALTQGGYSLLGTVSDAAGNSSEFERYIYVDLNVGAVAIDPLAGGDDRLNLAEASEGLTVTGTSSYLSYEENGYIAVTLGGKEYTTWIEESGNWSVTIPAADLLALQDGNYRVVVSAQDNAGNPISFERSLDVYVHNLPSPTLETPFGDGVLDSGEAAQGQTLVGSTGLVADGQRVVVSLAGIDYDVQVDGQGNWQLALSAEALQALPEGENSLTVTATDAEGNSVSVDRAFSVILTGLIIDPITDDNRLTASEADQDFTVTGHAAVSWAGAAVAVTFTFIPERSYSGTVDAEGNWSVTVPAGDLYYSTDNGLYTVEAVLTQEDGATATASREFTMDTRPLVGDIVLDLFTGDNTLTYDEQTQDQVLTGTYFAQEGPNANLLARVTLQDSGGQTFSYETRTDDNGNFSVTVPAADMLQIIGDWIGFSASVIDGAGNTVNGSVPLDVAVLPQGGGSITFDPVAGDNILTADEVADWLVISGDSNYLYDPRNGNQITVELNGLTKYFYIDSNSGSHWSVSFSPEELALLPDGSLTITASSTDLSGNSVIATTLLEVDLYSLPSPTLDTPFGDGVLDFLEAQQDQQLTGTTNQSGEGQSVTLELAGQIFSATVDENGAWSVLIPAGALADTENGNYPLTVTVNGPQGDTSLAQEVTLASGITLTLDTPFGDNVLDSTEAQLAQVITGNATYLGEGTLVSVFIDQYVFDGAVDETGHWSVTISEGSLAALPNGTYNMVVWLNNTFGNGVLNISQPVELAAIDPALVFDDFAGDNIVDGTEQFSDQTLSGEALAVPVGSLVTLTLGDLSYSTEVQADGRWSVQVTADDLAQLPDDTESLISGQITDADGNVLASSELGIFINRGLGTLSLDPLAEDSILTADEAADGLIVSGTITLWMVDTPVTVEFNGNTYQTTVTASNGSWQLTIPAEDLLGLTDGNYTLTASAEDAEGNALSASAPLVVDLNLQPELVFDPFAGDDIVGADEDSYDQPLSGLAYGVPAGSVVTITMGGHLSYTAEVQADQRWSVTISATDLQALPEQSDAVFFGQVTDADGNVLASADHTFYVDESYGNLSLDPLAGGDYILSAAEAAEGIIVSGTISRWEFGTPVYVELNGTTYQTSVTASNGTWDLYIPPAELLALPEGFYTVTVTSQDARGNNLIATAPLTVDLVSEPQPTLNTPFEDGVLNAQEAQLDQVLTGNTGLSGEGQSVRVAVNGISFTGTVDETGVWNLTLPSALLAGLPEGDNTLEITATNADGISTTLASTLVVDTTGPEVALGTVAGDNIANAAEMAAGVVVSGTSSEVGGRVNLQLLEGVSYDTEVQEDGSWEIRLPAGLLTHLRDGDYTLTVSQTDAEGNTTTVTETLRLDGDPRDLPTINIDRIGGDNVLNGAEVQSDQIITGTVKNVEAGQPVTVTLGDHTYIGVVLSGGSWAVSVPAADLLALGNGRETLTASVTDRSGNPAEADRDFTIKGRCPGLSIDPVTGDNLINASEADGAIVLSGETYDVRSGATVQLKLNGHRYSATVQKDGSWSTEIPASEAARLRDGELKLTANVKNRHGDRLSDSLTLDVHTRDLPDLSLETPFGDGTLNLADARTAQRLTGETGVRGEGQLVTLTLNGVDYSADVNNRGQWSVTLPAAALRALPEGELEVRVVAKDAAGNSAETTRTVLVDFTPPVLSLAPLPAIGLAEQSASFTLSGTATAAAGLVVLILLNGESYQAEVQEDGSWSTEIPSGALPAFEASWPLAISLTDEAGNTTDLTSSVTLRTEGDTATVETVAEGGDTAVESTLTTALASDTGSLTQDRAEANSEGSFTIGGVTLDLTKAGDEAQGGDGDDTIALYTLDFAHIDGGAGIDTLLLAGEDQHLDLVALGLKVEHIDIFDLGRTGSNSLTLNLDEALNVKDQPADGLLVKGAEGSLLNLAGDGSTWAESGQRQLDGLLFDVYHNSALESDNTLGDVLVQQGIVVHQI